MSPLKPHVKILRKKLPEDFFLGRHGINISTAVVRKNQRQLPTTSSFPRKSVKAEGVVRDALTARDYEKNSD